MVEVRNVIRISYDSEGALQHVVDLDVSTAAELPAMVDVVGGGKVLPTSTANIIQTGAWARLDEDGVWYNADGSGEISDDAANTLSAPLTLGKSPTLAKAVADSDGEYIDLTEPEIDAIRDELEITEPEGGEDDAELS